MSDSESDGEELQKIDHVVGPVEDAWKMKIPEFKSEDNLNGMVRLFFSISLKYFLVMQVILAGRKFFCNAFSQVP